MNLIEKQLNNFLESIVGNENFKPGLDRIKPAFLPIIDRLKKRNIKIITIAGTNGKGETAMGLSYLLNNSKKNTAMWTSPHIQSVTERFSFNDQAIASEELLVCFEENKQEISKYNFSYYEFLFYIFCKLCEKREHLDYIILEVGLGGRFDAVNIFDADLVGLTSISRDHEEILGHGLKNILNEKLGVCRSKTLLISSIEHNFLRQIIDKNSKELSFPWLDWHKLGQVDKNVDFVTQNRLMAYSLFKSLLGTSNEDLSQITTKELKNIEFPMLKGRFEKMTMGETSLIFIGAHNLDGLKKLRDILLNNQGFFEDKKIDLPFDDIVFSFSRRSEKEVDDCLELFAQAPCLANNMKLTYFDHFKSLPIKDLKKSYIKKDNQFGWIDSLEDYLNNLESNDSKTILFTGSYYFIGEVQKIILNL
jgi:dihydrofolate synthase/folylpolyglutamate synthase